MSKIWQRGLINEQKKKKKKSLCLPEHHTHTTTHTWPVVFWLACHRLWLQDKLAFYQHPYREQCIMSSDIFPFILNIFNRLYQLLIYIHLVGTPQLESLMSAALKTFCFHLNRLSQTYLQVDTPRSMNVLKRTGWLCMTSPNTSKMPTRSREEPGQHKWTQYSQGRLHRHRSSPLHDASSVCVSTACWFIYKTMRISAIGCHKCTCMWRWKLLKDTAEKRMDNKHAPSSHNHQSISAFSPLPLANICILITVSGVGIWHCHWTLMSLAHTRARMGACLM